jgi:DUF1009 family protein
MLVNGKSHLTGFSRVNRLSAVVKKSHRCRLQPRRKLRSRLRTHFFFKGEAQLARAQVSEIIRRYEAGDETLLRMIAEELEQDMRAGESESLGLK